MKKFFYIIFSMLGMCGNSYAQTTDWLIDARSIFRSYGVFVGQASYLVSGYEICSKIDNTRQWTNAFSQWKMRNSYYDNLRNNYDNRVKMQYGKEEHQKIVLYLQKSTKEAETEMQKDIQSNKDKFCEMVFDLLKEKKFDFINARPQDFNNLANAYTKK